MRILRALCLLGVAAALGPRASLAQAPTSAPPARLPNASPPPPPPQAADSAHARRVLLVPATPPPPPAPVPVGRTPDARPAAPPTTASLVVAPPADATMRCKDGTFLTGAPAADRCRDRGGVAAILPPRPVAPPAPRPNP